jgi:hypothetical protein
MEKTNKQQQQNIMRRGRVSSAKSREREIRGREEKGYVKPACHAGLDSPV